MTDKIQAKIIGASKPRIDGPQKLRGEKKGFLMAVP